MHIQKRTPPALAGAHGAKSHVKMQLQDSTPTEQESLAASIIAERHRITFPRAMLICRLAGIGGAL